MERFSRTLAIVLVVALLSVLVISASAAVIGISMSADVPVVQPGDKVTVMLTMEEAISVDANTTVLQLELNYDSDAVTYSSHTLSDDYSFLDVVVSEDAPVIKAYWIYLLDVDLGFDIDSENIDLDALEGAVANAEDELKNPENYVRELPAGTVLNVTFTVNEDVKAEEIVSSLSNSFTLSTDGDVTNTFNTSVAVQVCYLHEDTDEDSICDHCGFEVKSYTLGDVDGNGYINSMDAMMVLQRAVGMIGDDALILKAADVDGNGYVNSMDAMMILQFAVGMIKEF